MRDVAGLTVQRLAHRVVAATMLAMPLFHTPAHADALARYVQTQLTRQHLPGLALAVLKDGRRVQSRSCCDASWRSGCYNTRHQAGAAVVRVSASQP